jgi:prophage maintenance system killer protein
MQETKKGEIIIFKDQEGPAIQVLKLYEEETVWLSQIQMAQLFKTTVANINQHIRNVYFEHELEENRTIKKFLIVQNEGGREVERDVAFYNLDVIISIGYRVKSQRGIQFRIWATNRLREYLLKGYVINEKRLKDEHNSQLKELQQTVKLFQNVIEARRTEGYEKEFLNIIVDYANTWTVLHEYDEGKLGITGVSKKPARALDHVEIQKTILRFKSRLAAKREVSDLFGQEVGGKLEAVLGSIYQTYSGKELYPSLEEKAAHLLYFAIKDHPFVDGNKRIGCLLFLLFLIENNYFNNKKGERKVNDTALVALALLIAESKPVQKDVMVKLIVNLINRK